VYCIAIANVCNRDVNESLDLWYETKTRPRPSHISTRPRHLETTSRDCLETETSRPRLHSCFICYHTLEGRGTRRRHFTYQLSNDSTLSCYNTTWKCISIMMTTLVTSEPWSSIVLWTLAFNFYLIWFGVCGRGVGTVGSNSIQCTSCQKCRGINGSMYKVMKSFICRGC